MAKVSLVVLDRMTGLGQICAFVSLGCGMVYHCSVGCIVPNREILLHPRRWALRRSSSSKARFLTRSSKPSTSSKNTHAHLNSRKFPSNHSRSPTDLFSIALGNLDIFDVSGDGSSEGTSRVLDSWGHKYVREDRAGPAASLTSVSY